MLDPKMFLTDDGVDATTLIGKTVWMPNGFGGLSHFEVQGIDIVLKRDKSSLLEARVYGMGHDPWMECSGVRVDASGWGLEIFRSQIDDVVSEAKRCGIEIKYTIGVAAKETDK